MCMTKHHKIKAFTIQELVIVMIITAIVVGLSFTVLSLVQRHMFAIRNNFEQSNKIDLLESALWLDINKSAMVLRSPNENEIIFNKVLDTVIYEFRDSFILRDGDTIALKLESLKCFNKGQLQNEGRIDAIEVSFSKQRKDLRVFVFKNSEAAEHIN
jgi:hypothetical protein